MSTEDQQQISLAELIQYIVKHWWIVLTFSFITALLFFGYAKFIKPEIYEASAVILVDFDKSIHTKYGEYKPLSDNSEDYLSILHNELIISKTIDDLELNIKISEFSDRLSYSFKERGKSKSAKIELTSRNKDVGDVLNHHIRNFFSYLDILHKKKVHEYFSAKFTKQLELLQREVTYSKELITAYDSLLKEMNIHTTDKKYIEEMQKEGFHFSIQDYYNPSYLKMEEELIALKTDILEKKSEITKIRHLLNELNVNKELTSTNGLTDLKDMSDFFVIGEFMNIFVYPNNPKFPRPNTPVKLSLLGFLIGLFISLIFLVIKSMLIKID